MRLIILLFMVFCFFTACQNDKKAETTETKTTTPTDIPPKENKKYTLTPFSESKEYADAAIESVNYKKGKMTFNLAKNSSYKLGVQTPDAPQKNCANSAKGQHLHVLIDEEPYAARYTNSFDDIKLTDGNHLMLAFLSRSYHESIKTTEAHAAFAINVDKGSFAKTKRIEEPMVWYSRPKGTYKGKKDTEKVMLDFYLINTQLGGGNMVKANINGEDHMIDKWQPYYIEGLPMGKNRITLSLLDSSGNMVASPQNPITREFMLEEAIGE